MRKQRVGEVRPQSKRFNVTRKQKPRGHGVFRPLPPPTGPAPYRMEISSVLDPRVMSRIQKAGKMVLHMVGDTGGVKNPTPQLIVAKQMEMQLHTDKLEDSPAFFYHLGDVVYFFGEAQEYFPQFYDAYEYYNRPILAIPGNHDGGVGDEAIPSLDAFMRNFCALSPSITPEAGDVNRDAMTQPNCYFTLNTPLATIIGLYTNVPEGGKVEQDQREWFVGELSAAPKGKAVLVAMHHPPLSMDDHHSGSEEMRILLEDSFRKSGRVPTAVFSAHVHNYQRFTVRVRGDIEVSYIVAGNGGYHNLHQIPKGPDGEPLDTPLELPDENARLEAYVDDRHGFLRLTITAATLKGEFFPCPRPHESWSRPAKRYDVFEVKVKDHMLAPSSLNT